MTQRGRRQIVTGTGVTVGATLLMGGTAQAACNCTVDSLADPTDLGHTTLRDAITSAETSANSGSTITFASGLSGTVQLASPLPEITYPTTIQGPGAGLLAISGDDAHQILYLDSTTDGFPVTISGLTLTHGKATNFGTGAAIDTYNADLTISGAVLSENTGDNGAGAIWAYSGLGTLTIRDSTLTGNTATFSGGGAIYAVGQPISIHNSTFNGNHSAYRAPAIGIDDPTRPSLIENSTLTGNTTTNNSMFSRGGALYVYGAEGGVTVSGSTLVGNTATYGGGVFNHGAFGSPPVVLHNSIIANNTASSGTGPDLGGPFDSAFSLIKNTGGATINETIATSDITGQDPQLGSLAGNGGPTQTMKPALSSPVVDNGSAFGLASDQRGAARPLEIPSIPNTTAPGADGSDIGAVELQASDVPAPATPATAVTPKKKKCKKRKHKRSADAAKKHKKCKKKKKKR